MPLRWLYTERERERECFTAKYSCTHTFFFFFLFLLWFIGSEDIFPFVEMSAVRHGVFVAFKGREDRGSVY